MTKDELLTTKCSVQLSNSDISYVTLKNIEKFLESNVCIPRGSNPHIDADELHKWVEDPTLDMFLISSDGTTHQTYDIKAYQMPQKTYTINKSMMPIYKWQFVIIDEGNASITDEYFTIEEFWNIHSGSEFDSAYPLEKTKKISNCLHSN
jgi:hypothetical protein